MLTTVATALLGVLPVIAVPSWLSSSSGAVSQVFAAAGSMSVWFPAALVMTILAGVSALWLAAFGVKAARIVASFLTGGGGSAA
jgi:hypothetical protein